MTDAISIQLFEHLVQLAALELGSTEAEYLRQQLNNQLKSIDELLAVPIDPEIPPASHGVSYSPAASQTARADLWEPEQNTKEILDQAPQFEDGHIIVPEIPHTEL